MTKQAKLRIDQLTKIFGKTPTQRPLQMLRQGHSKEEILARTGHVVGVDNVSFDVQEGEIFVVMGLSGSGKSTLIRCLNRLIEPTAGHIYLDDLDVTRASTQELREIRRSRMAMVFQYFGLFPHRTVAFNVGYGLRVRGVPEAEWRAKALAALELVGLEEWAEHHPENLSGGMPLPLCGPLRYAQRTIWVVRRRSAYSHCRGQRQVAGRGLPAGSAVGPGCGRRGRRRGLRDRRSPVRPLSDLTLRSDEFCFCAPSARAASAGVDEETK